MKQKYLALMEQVLSAYSEEHILRYYDQVRTNGLKEHGFPRLTANIGVLMCHGKVLHLKDLFEKMMDTCCYYFLKKRACNEFSVREIITCLMEIEACGLFPKNKTDFWRNQLSQIDLEVCYHRFSRTPDQMEYNWGLFTAVSEFMRGYIGVADTNDFVDMQIGVQLTWLDENGMYRDPGNPMMYDLVGRGLFHFLLHFGYNGKYARQIDEALKKAGLLTLQMQSVTGELPYGGRSHQFLHNEAWLALIYEFEANRYFREGNFALAGQFKAAAQKSLADMEKWLSQTPITHIKNHFPPDSHFGCEVYAYFDKYMITCASFLYVGYLFCNESIPPVEIPQKPEVLFLSQDFHKAFLKNKNYYVEIDPEADPEYDCSGIGRIHYVGAPSALCLSVPGAKGAEYETGDYEKIDFSITAGVKQGSDYLFATDTSTKYTLVDSSCNDHTAMVAYDCSIPESISVKFTCQLLEDVIVLTASSAGTAAIMLPIFYFDGKNYTDIAVSENSISVSYEGYVFTYSANGRIVDLKQNGANRNGVYKLFCAENPNSITVEIQAKKMS